MQDKKHNNLLARIFTILVIQAFFFSNISYALADIKTREKASNLSALIRISYPDFQQMFYRAGYVLSEKDTNPRNYYTSSVMELTEKQKPSQ
ncbi:MAG: hypothetical protein KKF93_00005, partial [Candidatus Omnitrophica bacterium]|nr:hypothetical protein [Candidatus Omnitrophota bacterium]